MGLQQNIEDAYRYLMDRYLPGDKVFLFGFSRGAYTVRALAGMLHKCGLLQKGSNNLIPYASKIYNTPNNEEIAAGFQETYCNDCKPYLIGVWDTVGSLGWLRRKQFFDATLHEGVTYGYHAISVDERRKKFPVSLWDEGRKHAHQTIEQVWFPGVHSDVGGSYAETGLSDIALMWMLANARAQGLRLKNSWANKFSPDSSGVIHESRAGFWRIWRPAVRRIPEFAKIHKSVFDRMNNGQTNYQPKNLPDSFTLV